MRNTTLHGVLEAFTADAAGQLAAETARGAEIPFEVVENEGRPGRTALYCYRPLTGAFIRERLGLLGALPTWPYSQGWGYYPSGGLGLVLLILLIMAVMRGSTP